MLLLSDELGQSGAGAIRNAYNRQTVACSSIDGVPVGKLVAHYGSPLFVFSERTILATARRAKRAFKSVYPDTQFAWSYKTNYLRAVCAVFHSEGWIAEVVSEFEYRKAKPAGTPIIYNGPCKSKAGINQAIDDGAVIQIDHWDELALIEALDRPAIVGVRLWTDTKYAPVWSKFGFALDNGEASRAIMRIVTNPKLGLHTLHTHIGTFVTEPKAYAIAAARLLSLRQLLHRQTGCLVPCINLGGGFPSGARLHEQPEGASVPSIEAYAKAIAGELNRLPRKLRPLLRLETGRHLIDDAGYLITSVAAVKAGSYIVDTGIHQLYTAPWFRINVSPTRGGPCESVKLFGSLCMNIDVIRDRVELPSLEVGDALVLHPVGAYNLTQSMQFIGLRPAVVMIGKQGPEVIRRREELSDLEGPEHDRRHHS
jgi:diaminopimelate decarboxylase